MEDSIRSLVKPILTTLETNQGTDPLRYPATDWFDELVGDQAFMMSHTFTINAGTDKKAGSETSLNYLNQDGIGLNNQMDRYSLRINNENDLADNFTLGTNLFVAWSDIVPIVEGEVSSVNTQQGVQQGGFRHMGMQNMPLIPAIQSPDGRWGGPQVDGAGTTTNWVALGFCD